MESEFPSNSHSGRSRIRPRNDRDETPEKPEAVKVTTGRVIVRKKPLYKKFIEAFKPEDNKGFLEHMLIDVIAPGIRNAFGDAAHDMVDNMFDQRSYSRRSAGRSRGGAYTSYQAMSKKRSRRSEDRPSRNRAPEFDAEDLEEFIVESRVEAEHVLDIMYETLSRYKAVTIRDFKSNLGLEIDSFTDEDWGWTDLRGARVHRVSGGYLIDLPRPEALD